MCLRLVKYCWTSLGLLLEERSHGIDCLLREQSIFEITKTCVQITIRNAALTKTCAYEIHFCGKAASAKNFLSLFENATISAFLSTFYWCRRLCGPRSAVVFPGKEEIVFFSCPDLCLHKLVPHQFIHKSICVQTFVEFENSSFFLDFFFISPVRHASPASDSRTGSVNGKNMQIFLTHQIGAQFKLLRLF